MRITGEQRRSGMDAGIGDPVGGLYRVAAGPVVRAVVIMQRQHRSARFLRRRRGAQQRVDAADQKIEFAGERQIQRPRPSAFTAGEKQFAASRLRDVQHPQWRIQQPQRLVQRLAQMVDRHGVGKRRHHRRRRVHRQPQQHRKQRRKFHSGEVSGGFFTSREIFLQFFAPFFHCAA